MMNRLLCAFSVFLLAIQPVLAQKTEVLITPVEKVTTANERVSEGDYVEFRVVNSDKKLRGLVTKYVKNGFGGQEAVLVLEQFRALNSDDIYEGTIAINGNQHNGIMEFFSGVALYVRGGEVTILPERDVFSLWRVE